MRVTNSMVGRRYVNNLQTNFFRKNQTEQRVLTMRKFHRASQDPTEAVKALRNRKAMSEIETYQKNLSNAAGIYEAAEESVRGVSSIMQKLHEKLVAAANGTYALDPDKQIFALEVDELASQMLRLMNLVVADRNIFGGVNNTDTAFQFADRMEVNATGDLVPVICPVSGAPVRDVLYNGVPVNAHSNPADFPDGRSAFMDAGLGMDWLNPYTIDPQTAIPVTFNGAKILGSGTNSSVRFGDLTVPGNTGPYTIELTYRGRDPQNITFSNLEELKSRLPSGVTAFSTNGQISIHSVNPEHSLEVTSGDIEILEGYPNNIIQLTLDAANAVRRGTNEEIMLYAEMLFVAGSSLSFAIASIGSEQSFIEFNQERLTNNMFTLQQRENDLEFVDLGEETTRWKMLEMIYNATLQMSVSVTPMSIFNFMK